MEKALPDERAHAFRIAAFPHDLAASTTEHLKKRVSLEWDAAERWFQGEAVRGSRDVCQLCLSRGIP